MRARFFGTIALLLLCVARPDGTAFAAVVYDITARDQGLAKLSNPYSVAVDSLGSFYVVDQQKHHVVKFGPDGSPKLVIGSYGFGNGHLYYPQGIAVGLHSNGDTLVYVADTANSRVVVFDDEGNYIGKFGDTTPAGSLSNPGGIAYVKKRGSPGGLVFVADTRNHRIMLFNDNGSFVREYRCTDCPAGGIRPLGVAARLTPGGPLQISAVDELTSQVQVLNSVGGWVRSISQRGTAQGDLQAPHGIAVDEDGSVWVADSGFAGGSTERISKFGPGGAFLYAFNTTGNSTFIQPHGVGLDEQGRIYVADTGAGDVYRFKEQAPTLTVRQRAFRPYWINTKGAWFDLFYNGVEQTCRAGGSATVRAPAAGGQTFSIDGGPITITYNDGGPLKMDMTTYQTNLVDRTWDQGKNIAVSGRFQARCQDGILLTKTLTFQK